MKTKKEVKTMLENLQWERFTKKGLTKYLNDFFGINNELENGTEVGCKNGIDWSFLYTTGEGDSYINFIDIEIWYAKTRSGQLLITGTELLDYVA